MPVCVAPSRRVLALGPSTVSDFMKRLPPSVSRNAPNSAVDPIFSRIFALNSDVTFSCSRRRLPSAITKTIQAMSAKKPTPTTIGMNAWNTSFAITVLLCWERFHNPFSRREPAAARRL